MMAVVDVMLLEELREDLGCPGGAGRVSNKLNSLIRGCIDGTAASTVTESGSHPSVEVDDTDSDTRWSPTPPMRPGVYLEVVDIYHHHTPARLIIVEEFSPSMLTWKDGMDATFRGRVEDLKGMYYLGPLSDLPKTRFR